MERNIEDNNNPRKSSYKSCITDSDSSSSSSVRLLRSCSNNNNNNNNNNNYNNNNYNNYKAEKVIKAATTNSSSSKVGSSTASLEENHGHPNDFSNVQSIVGSCPFMCPEIEIVKLDMLNHATGMVTPIWRRERESQLHKSEVINSLFYYLKQQKCAVKERSQREQLRDLAIFERLYGNPSNSSSTLAVKKFCRTISTKDVQPTDLRPLPVLEDTLNYLINLLDSSEQPFELVHDFIFDRTRSIRQDLSMQNICNDRVISMYEKMVKFHIVSHYKLRRCEGDSTIISSIHYLNREQLTKCLASLYNLYDVNRSSNCIYDHEAEFRSLYVLLHLDSQSHSTVESLSLWLSCLPSFIIKSKKMCFARSVLRFYQIGNFWHFFRILAAEATCLQLYIIEPYISQVWGRALECINYSGYKLHPYPLSNLSKSLMIKELDLEAFCNACGLVISEDDMGNKFLPTKQTGFCFPKDRFRGLDSSLLEILLVCRK